MNELVDVDRDTWRDFMHLAFAPGQEGHCSPPERILARAWAHREFDAVVWGIAVDGTPAGLTMWWTLERPTGSRWLVVDQLLVDAGAQHRGIGRWVLRQAAEEARRRGCDGLTCCVIAGNIESEGLVTSCGFQRDPAKDDGDELSWVKHLG